MVHVLLVLHFPSALTRFRIILRYLSVWFFTFHQDILCWHSWSPEDESYWLKCSSSFSSSTTSAGFISPYLLKYCISTVIWWISTKYVTICAISHSHASVFHNVSVMYSFSNNNNPVVDDAKFKFQALSNQACSSTYLQSPMSLRISTQSL